MGHWASGDEDSNFQLFTEVMWVTSEPSASFVPLPVFFCPIFIKTVNLFRFISKSMVQGRLMRSGLHCIAGSRAVLGDPSPWLPVATRHCWDLIACVTPVNARSSVLTRSSHGTSGEPLLPLAYPCLSKTNLFGGGAMRFVNTKALGHSSYSQ